MSLTHPVPPLDLARVPGSPVDEELLRSRVDRTLESFLDRQEAVLATVSPELGPLTGTVREFLDSGGKRLRPAFCYWGWRGAGGAADDDGAVAACSALELLQASALVHDDLIDRSDTRRGLPSVHRRFEALHRERGWHGDGAQFGAASALLLGDLLLAWCDELLWGGGLPPAAVRRAKPVFDLMRTEVMAGQYLDLLEPATAGLPGTDRGGAIDRARTVVHYKAAKYTVERPLQIGGLLAGADPALTAAYAAFGLPLGEAFQLRDDLLGVFGDPEVTGKPAGDDLREGKRTLLVAEASAAGDAGLLDELLGTPDLSDHEVGLLRAAIVRSGAPERIEQRIAALRCEALAALDDAPLVEPEARRVLRRLAGAATARRY